MTSRKQSRTRNVAFRMLAVGLVSLMLMLLVGPVGTTLAGGDPPPGFITVLVQGQATLCDSKAPVQGAKVVVFSKKNPDLKVETTTNQEGKFSVLAILFGSHAQAALADLGIEFVGYVIKQLTTFVLSGLFGSSISISACVQDVPCRCTNMTLRTAGGAWGPDGNAGGDTWPPFSSSGVEVWNGTALGPINTANYWGFAFEIVCDVQGEPSKCKEIQLVKRTFEEGGNQEHTRWEGLRIDWDLDGTTDLDVSTQEKCRNAGGQWAVSGFQNCTLAFPSFHNRYKPDEAEEGTHAHRKEGEYKKYTNHPTDRTLKRIIWADAPGRAGGIAAGARWEAHFIAMVKDSDSDTYCVCKWTLRGQHPNPMEITAVQCENRISKEKLCRGFLGGSLTSDGSCQIP